MRMRTSTSQLEGAQRDFSVMTTGLSGQLGQVTTLHAVRLDENMKPLPGTDFDVKCDLVLLAMGFLHPVHKGMIEDLDVQVDARGNIAADEQDYRTSHDRVFAAGDMRRGQSLVVWAIREGRQAAHAIDKFLMGSTLLPR